ncbi:MAG: TonB-dependent receptor [Myxococcota bacterium]
MTVVEMVEFELEAADLGQLLTRQEGVSVRRSGGLGSNVRFALNGLSGNQVRFFVDGVPLELSGFGFAVADVSPALIDSITIYRGIVPTRLGADALGGAVELRTNSQVLDPQLELSYSAGSFGSHRFAASGALPVGDDGFFVRASGFFDRTDNDYFSEQDSDDPFTGAVEEQLPVRRFHDGFQAFGASFTTGWSDNLDFGSLTVTGFVNGLDKELQQDLVPFSAAAIGEAQRSTLSTGGALRFDVPFGERLRWFGAGGITRVESNFLDVSTCIYLWSTGECGPITREIPGELGAPSDSTQINLTYYLRTSIELSIVANHRLRVSAAPTFIEASGEERYEGRTRGGGNTVDADRNLLTAVLGLEYEAAWLAERLKTVVFGKWYGLTGRTGTDAIAREIDLSDDFAGAGALVRYRLLSSVDLEGSYEYAVRLPTQAEYFGTPGQVFENPSLQPERGHNANASLRLRPWTTNIGVFDGLLNGFLRDVDNLIRLEGLGELLQFNNVSAARSVGLEGTLGWSSLGDLFSLNGSMTYMDFRNLSTSGRDVIAEGDRIPNTPFLFGALTARLRFENILFNDDEVLLSLSARAMESFFVSFESLGRPDSKDRVEAQFESSLNLGYRFGPLDKRFAVALDVQNLTDNRLFDFFGIQRPGRAVFIRLNAEIFP